MTGATPPASVNGTQPNVLMPVPEGTPLAKVLYHLIGGAGAADDLTQIHGVGAHTRRTRVNVKTARWNNRGCSWPSPRRRNNSIDNRTKNY